MISVACVYLMVIAAFYVIASDVRAESVDDLPGDQEDQVSIVEHLDRRITISDNGASIPQVVVNGNVTHLFWVDGKEGSQKLAWKCSNDSLSTFTPDTTLTSTFYSITDISLSVSDDRIAATFEAKVTESSPSTVYLLYSTDSEEWSSAYSVAPGDSPVLFASEDGQYLGMNTVIDGDRHLSVISIKWQKGEINATMVATLPITADAVDMIFNDGLIDIAFCYGISSSMLFMQLTGNGTVVTSPAMICQAQNAKGLDLQIVNGELWVLFIEAGSIRLARCLGDPAYWTTCYPIESAESIIEVSMSPVGDSIRIAYAIENSNGSAVCITDLDQQSQIVVGPQMISTPGLNARSPIVFSTSPGVISCIYVEEHYDSQELFLKYDMDFTIPDIPHLKKYIESLDPAMLVEGNVS
ncbi:MAG: hypothetical protein MIO90_07015, partial [Methanomassiliicoccales archaeon]|nr:hypothetical protein [Methanomassiliicoccales archaeon]